jgi:hypothetical protein
MVRNGYKRRLLTVLLVLLTVTPDSLLRSCCCSRNQAQAADLQAGDFGQEVIAQNTLPAVDQQYSDASLRPCCQKRLEASRRLLSSRSASPQSGASQSGASCCRQKSSTNLTNSGPANVSLSNVPEIHVVGINSSGSCCCRSNQRTARVERVIFRQSDVEKLLAILIPFDASVAGLQTQPAMRLFAASDPGGMRSSPSCAQLCRWVI